MEKTTVGLLITINVMYVCIGAAIFMTLESKNEETSSTEILSTVNAFIGNHSSCLSSSELQTLIRQVLTAYDNGVFTTNATSSPTQWDYSNSLFFSMTVTTTIGYGNQSPVTIGGRIFVIFFALLGIPLAGIMLVGVGEKLKNVVYLIQKKKWTQYDRIEGVVKLILTNLFIFGLLIILPAGIFHIVEDWTYFESLYYCFVTLFTIGFGDFVVATNSEQNYRVLYKILVNLWIYLGLAWFATIISYFTDIYSKRIQKTEDKYKAKTQKGIEQKQKDEKSTDNGVL